MDGQSEVTTSTALALGLVYNVAIDVCILLEGRAQYRSFNNDGFVKAKLTSLGALTAAPYGTAVLSPCIMNGLMFMFRQSGIKTKKQKHIWTQLLIYC